ncbi:MAG: LPS assembly lipoprotein LptE [Candidatus Ratteibacteria bacterium]
MARILRLLSLPLLSFALLSLAGCAGYSIVSDSKSTVYVHPFLNKTLEPQLDLFLTRQLKKIILERPGISLAQDETHADIVIKGTIVECVRGVDFFSKDEEVEMARYTVSIAYAFHSGENKTSDTLTGVWHASLVTGFNRYSLLSNLADSLANSIYMRLIEYVQN